MSGRRPRAAARSPAQTLTVTAVGAEGDGVAALPDGTTAYLPFTLPGEHVHVPYLTRRGSSWTGDAERLTDSPDRQPPPCPHFGACGGCTLQHWQDTPYGAWKTDQLRAALARAGFPGAPVAPLARTAPGERRRMDLALRRQGTTVQVGLHRHRAADVVDLHTCLVLAPALVRLIAHLRQGLASLSALQREGSARANLLEDGIDLLLHTDARLTLQDRAALVAFAEEAGCCRITHAVGRQMPELVCALSPARTAFGDALVTLPPGAFLQASPAAEAAIRAAVLAGLPAKLGRKPIVELFAGVGTLTFALAGRSRVLAFEGDGEAAAALRRAAAGRPITVAQRDLARQPLTAAELAGAAAVVLDPPFAGAAAQMPGLAACKVPHILYVSCNPAALARDGRVLAGAGYQLIQAVPIDQFLWSAAVEAVCVFARA